MPDRILFIVFKLSVFSIVFGILLLEIIHELTEIFSFQANIFSADV
jgi:hypothetical protein